jgi:hypothetical protein
VRKLQAAAQIYRWRGAVAGRLRQDDRSQFLFLLIDVWSDRPDYWIIFEDLALREPESISN